GLMLHPLPGQEHHGRWKLALAATVGLVWLSTDALAKRRPGQTLPLAMMLIVSAAAVTLAEAGIAKFANMTGSLACMCGFIWVATALARRTPMAGGAIAVLAVLLPALMTM